MHVYDVEFLAVIQAKPANQKRPLEAFSKRQVILFRSLSNLRRPSSSLVMEVLEPRARIFSFQPVSDDVSPNLSDVHLEAAPPQRSNPTSFPGPLFSLLGCRRRKAISSLYSSILDLDYSPLCVPHLLTLTCLSV